MLAAVSRQYHNTVQVFSEHKVTTVISLVVTAGTVYKIWGQVALVCFVGTVFLAYQAVGKVYRILTFDVQSLWIFGSVVATPFLAGIPAYLNVAYSGTAILIRQWRAVRVEEGQEALIKQLEEGNRIYAQFVEQFTQLGKRLEVVFNQAQLGNIAQQGIVEAGEERQRLEQQARVEIFTELTRVYTDIEKLVRCAESVGKDNLFIKQVQLVGQGQIQLAQLQAKLQETLKRIDQAIGKVEVENTQLNEMVRLLEQLDQNFQNTLNTLNQRG